MKPPQTTAKLQCSCQTCCGAATLLLEEEEEEEDLQVAHDITRSIARSSRWLTTWAPQRSLEKTQWGQRTTFKKQRRWESWRSKFTDILVVYVFCLDIPACLWIKQWITELNRRFANHSCCHYFHFAWLLWRRSRRFQADHLLPVTVVLICVSQPVEGVMRRRGGRAGQWHHRFQLKDNTALGSCSKPDRTLPSNFTVFHLFGFTPCGVAENAVFVSTQKPKPRNWLFSVKPAFV